MLTSSLAVALTIGILFPAPKDPEPDDKGRGFFGVQLVDNGGVFITRVEAGSPADKAGITAGDMIFAIDKLPIQNVDEARELIAGLRPGTVTFVELRRGAATVNVKLKVGIRPDTLP